MNQFAGVIVPLNTFQNANTLKPNYFNYSGTEAISTWQQTGISQSIVEDVKFIRIDGRYNIVDASMPVVIEVKEPDLSNIIASNPVFGIYSKVIAGTAICLAYMVAQVVKSGSYEITQSLVSNLNLDYGMGTLMASRLGRYGKTPTEARFLNAGVM